MNMIFVIITFFFLSIVSADDCSRKFELDEILQDKHPMKDYIPIILYYDKELNSELRKFANDLRNDPKLRRKALIHLSLDKRFRKVIDEKKKKK